MVAETRTQRCRGVVLPVALMLLVVVLLAGVSAARVAVSHHTFSDNLRTTQVARQAAEAGLRYCEDVALDLVDNDSQRFGSAVTGKILQPAPPLADIATAHWTQLTHWSSGAAQLLTAPQAYSDGVKTEAQLVNPPTCMAERISDDRILITARGLSNNATTDGDGRLITGSEVWLQSILKPVPAIASNTGGIQ